MAAHGLEERRSTLAKAKTINGGRAYQTTVDDETVITRDASGRVNPYAVLSFGTPIKTARDRNIANSELGQPHRLPTTLACIGGTADDAQALMAAYVSLLVDWRPSDSADPFELQGGYSDKASATSNTPTRYVETLFLSTVVNQNIVA